MQELIKDPQRQGVERIGKSQMEIIKPTQEEEILPRQINHGLTKTLSKQTIQSPHDFPTKSSAI